MIAFTTVVVAVLGATELPRAPCEARGEVELALSAAAQTGTSELDTQLAVLDGLLGYSLLRAAPKQDELSGPSRVKLALARLDAVCAVQTRSSQRVAPPVAPARLAAILERPEFDGARERKGDVFGALMKRAWEWLTALFETRAMTTGASITRLLVLGLAAAVAIFGLLRLRSIRRRSKQVSSSSSKAGPLVLEDPSAHLGRAREALAGDARLAIREALLALLSTLERQRWARPDRVKTNRELARELPGRGAPSEVAAQVETLIHWYDRTFYSLAPVPPDEARRFVEEIAAFEGRVSSRGAGA